MCSTTNADGDYRRGRSRKRKAWRRRWRDCNWPRSGQSFSHSSSCATLECPLVADGKPGVTTSAYRRFQFYGMMDIGGVTGQLNRWVSLVSADWCSLNPASLSNLAHLCPSEVRKTSIFPGVWMINLACYLMTDAQILSLPFEVDIMGLTCLFFWLILDAESSVNTPQHASMTVKLTQIEGSADY